MNTYDPSPGSAWLLVSLLTVAYVVSFVGRYILSLLVEPVKADLGLTDFQIGLLLGPARTDCRAHARGERRVRALSLKPCRL